MVFEVEAFINALASNAVNFIFAFSFSSGGKVLPVFSTYFKRFIPIHKCGHVRFRIEMGTELPELANPRMENMRDFACC